MAVAIILGLKRTVLRVSAKGCRFLKVPMPWDQTKMLFKTKMGTAKKVPLLPKRAWIKGMPIKPQLL